ncbi:MAG: transposase [Bacteroidota bacterium]
MEQNQRLHGHCPEEVIYDWGGKVGDTTVSVPAPPLKRDGDHQKRKKRKKFRRRAAIEPVIGHLKKQFRMQENYLMGKKSPKINVMLAATGWNLRKLIEKLTEDLLWAFFQLPLLNVQSLKMPSVRVHKD